jgi:hypothetical protein
MHKLNTLFVLSLLSTPALADADLSAANTSIPAVDQALELTVGLMSAHGAGNIGGDLPAVRDVGGSGLAIDASIGWRATRNFSFGGYLNAGGFGNPDSSSDGAATFAAGIKADWHFMPAAKLDPWVSIGTGVKVMAIENGDDERAFTGLEVARLQLGLDIRRSARFAWGPVIGVSATQFNTQYDDAMDHAMDIRDKQINWTFSVGVLGRFDTFRATR